MRRRAAAVIALIGVVAGCRAGTDQPAEPSPEATVAITDASTDPARRSSVAGAGAGTVLIDEDFTTGTGPFFTDAGRDFEIALGRGRLEVFIEARGAADPNVVRERVNIPSSRGGVAVEATIEVVEVGDSGSGGFGLRCYAGDDYYLFFWDVVRADGTTPEAAIVRQRGTSFDVLAARDQPAGVVGGDRRAAFRGECDRGLVDGDVELRFLVDGVEVVDAVDDQGSTGLFDAIAVGGEWTGERVPATTLTPAAGMTFAVDDVRATAL